MKQWTCSKFGNGYPKAVYFSLAYLTYRQSTSCEMPGWMKHKPESRFLGVLASSTYTKIGVIQGRLGLARPLPKNDMQLCEVVHIFDV